MVPFQPVLVQLIFWAAICSVILLIFQGLLVKFDLVRRHNDDRVETDKESRVFSALRFLGCLVILALEVAEVVDRDARVEKLEDVMLCLVFVRILF